MPTINVDNQRLFYTKQTIPSAETGALPALLLVHGAGGSHLDWPATLRRFAGATIVALDLPGHGRSEAPGRRHIEAYATCVEQVLTNLDLGPTVIVGHSMGGAIALTLGLAPNPQVVGLVLMGTGAHLPVSDFLLKAARDDFTAAAAFVTRYAWGRNAPEQARTAGKQRLATADPAVTYGDFLACNGFDIQPHLGSIDLPALVIGGEADRMTPPALSQALADGLPRARLVMLAGAGHMMALEKPRATAEVIRSFLGELM